MIENQLANSVTAQINLWFTVKFLSYKRIPLLVDVEFVSRFMNVAHKSKEPDEHKSIEFFIHFFYDEYVKFIEIKSFHWLESQLSVIPSNEVSNLKYESK